MEIVTWLLVTLVLGFAGSTIHFIFKARGNSEYLEEYKELFTEADALQREGHVRVEKLLAELGIKNLEVERVNEIAKQVPLRDAEIEGLQNAVIFQETQYNKILSQKKSSEVRTGKITEQIAPFLADYPKNSSTARFIGDPIDFVHFDEDQVTFVEVKSGKSTLSKKQRHIRDLITQGKVEFIIYRVEGN